VGPKTRGGSRLTTSLTGAVELTAPPPLPRVNDSTEGSQYRRGPGVELRAPASQWVGRPHSCNGHRIVTSVRR